MFKIQFFLIGYKISEVLVEMLRHLQFMIIFYSDVTINTNVKNKIINFIHTSKKFVLYNIHR